jgi:hypothetical protein
LAQDPVPPWADPAWRRTPSSTPADDGRRDVTPTVPFRRGKDDDSDPAARFHDTAPLAQRGRGVRHGHQTKPTRHRIEGPVGEFGFLAVHGAGLDLPEPAFEGDLARKLDDPFRDVGRQHAAAGAHPFGGTDRRFTGPGGDVQMRCPGWIRARSSIWRVTSPYQRSSVACQRRQAAPSLFHCSRCAFLYLAAANGGR